HLLLQGGVFDENAMEQRVHGKRVAHGRHIAVTAQSPSETRIRTRDLTSRIFCSSSSELTEPSTSTTSTFRGKTLASTSGEYTSSNCGLSSISRSSMSSNDMWHPEQPSSQIVARVALLIVRSPAFH